MLQTLVGELNQSASSAALSGADGQLGGCRTDVSSVTDARDAGDLAQSLRAQVTRQQMTPAGGVRAKDAATVSTNTLATAEYDARSHPDGRVLSFVYDAEMRGRRKRPTVSQCSRSSARDGVL